MQIGVLTGGGDCPGLNAVIRAVVRKGVQVTVIGSSDSGTGGEGHSRARRCRWTSRHVRGILPQGGTILGSIRTNPYKARGRERAVSREGRERGWTA